MQASLLAAIFLRIPIKIIRKYGEIVKTLLFILDLYKLQFVSGYRRPVTLLATLKEARMSLCICHVALYAVFHSKSSLQGPG